jgi:DNA repair protein RadC
MDGQIHKGHRKRMRRKFSDFGAIVFDTYELLEMLLYYTVPVKDTNPIAKRLLQTFGSLDGVFSADRNALMSVEGVGGRTADFIVASGKALEFFSSGRREASSFEKYDVLGRFTVDYFAQKEEYLQILLSFDNDMHLLGIDELYDCDHSSAAVKSNKYIDAILRRGATVAVIAHNHPYGPLCPSEGDRTTTNMILKSLSNIGVLLAEHYIVSGSRYVGFMNHIGSSFAQKPRIAEFIRSKKESQNVLD